MPDSLAPLAAPPALAAFLKGVERRGAVLAELQAGEAGIGDAALTRAMAAFRPQALEHPMADWPRLFWAALLAQPALRRARHARWPADLPRAATPGLRAALLLRLVAGLEEDEAAAVLDVAPGMLRRALERVVPRAADGRPDAAAWARQRQALQQRVRDLPADRALRLARGREAALAGPAERFFPAPERGRAWPLAGVVAAVALALAATWWLERRVDDRVDVLTLGPPGKPASRYSPTAGLVAHPDFAQLADPDGERLALDVAFLSWSAAQAAAAAAPVDPLAPRPAPPQALVPIAPYGESAGAP
ncbi:MAG: hypothetical protein ACOY37_13640 [Pseudomonadota bacterium]